MAPLAPPLRLHQETCVFVVWRWAVAGALLCYYTSADTLDTLSHLNNKHYKHTYNTWNNKHNGIGDIKFTNTLTYLCIWKNKNLLDRFSKKGNHLVNNESLQLGARGVGVVYKTWQTVYKNIFVLYLIRICCVNV